MASLAMDQLWHNTRVIALNRHASGTLEHPSRRGTRFGIRSHPVDQETAGRPGATR